ncbi:MAG: ankyrin repeat domain-containing protein [Planctomycetaceae bacterium]|nr:ankyrin repeat domain-containing protein [Planctomycetaceae bacterium]
MNTGDRDGAANDDGGTLLHQAIALDVHALANLLKSPEFDVNARDNNGRTPLHSAVQVSCFIVEALVSQGADVNAKDVNGYTPLYVATHNKNIEIMSFLISVGSVIHTKDNNGRTPLHWAAGKIAPIERCLSGDDKVKATKLLVLHGADVNAKDNDGKTTLHWAILDNNLEVVKFLVFQGADIYAKTNDGKTTLDVAKENGNSAIAKFLIEQGCSGEIPSGNEFEENSATDTDDSTYKDDIDHLNGDWEESLDPKTITEVKSLLRQASRFINKALRKLEDQ